MELQSASRLSSQSLPGAPRRSRPGRCPNDSGEDRISSLPEDLLLQILVRLRCARAAAATSFLALRWRGLWKHLVELAFREIPLDAVDAALQQVVCPTLSRLEIKITKRHRIKPARVTALLHAAAQLAPADLVIDVWGDLDYKFAIEIPCFERATSIKLHVANLYLTLPAGRAEFPLLEKVDLACGFFDNMNMVELISRCPRLRVLEARGCRGLNMITVHSPTMEELVVDGWLTNIDIVAPKLKQFTLQGYMSSDFNLFFSTPMVEDLSWECKFERYTMWFAEIWCVRGMDVRTEESSYVLTLEIDFPVSDEYVVADIDLFQRIAPLPEFSVLEIYLVSDGHVFGAMMLNLLGIFTNILRLEVIMQCPGRTQACPPDCLCGESSNWRSQTIPLTSLEEIKIYGFEGTDHEVDFLKLMFRCATLMKRMTVKLSRKLSRSNRGYKEMLSIFEANPSVKCSVYRGSGMF